MWHSIIIQCNTYIKLNSTKLLLIAARFRILLFSKYYCRINITMNFNELPKSIKQRVLLIYIYIYICPVHCLPDYCSHPLGHQRIFPRRMYHSDDFPIRKTNKLLRRNTIVWYKICLQFIAPNTMQKG